MKAVIKGVIFVDTLELAFYIIDTVLLTAIFILELYWFRLQQVALENDRAKGEEKLVNSKLL